MKGQRTPRAEAAWRRVEGALVTTNFFASNVDSYAKWQLSVKQKIAALAILREAVPSAGASAVAEFLESLREAVVRFHARKGIDPDKAVKKLTALLSGLIAARNAWGDICEDDQLHSSLIYAIGVFPSALGVGGLLKDGDRQRAFKALGISTRDLFDKIDWARHFDVALCGDIDRLRSEIERLLAALQRRTTKVSPLVHGCVWDIAFAWWNIVGTIPTYSLNQGAERASPTPFQRLVSVLVPDSVSLGVLRDVVDAFRLKATLNRDFGLGGTTSGRSIEK